MPKCSTIRLIKLINNNLQKEINKRLKDCNITKSQAEILLYIKYRNEQSEELNQIDLQNEFNLTNPTITGILNRLEKKQMIKRISSKKNARFKNIIITNIGKEELQDGEKELDIIEKEILSKFTKEEKEILNIILEKIFESMLRKE